VPQLCSVCTHPDRAAIDAALVAGGSLRDIAGRHGVSKSAVDRHRDQHLPARLVKAREAEDVGQADTLLGQLQQLQTDARRIGRKAEDGGDLRTALAGIRELVRIVEITAKMVGELDERPVVNLVTAPEWVVARSVLLDALRPYPEARQAVASSLLALEASA